MIKKSVSVVYPAFNEEKNVERAIDAAVEVLEEIEVDYEIIVVDDASTDRTVQLVKAAQGSNPHIRLISLEKNTHYCGALKTGMFSATKELILYSDTDLPFDMNELKKALHIMKVTNADVIMAYRFNRIAEGNIRIIYSFFYNSLVRHLFGLRIQDINFAFKLFKRKLLEGIELKSIGSFIDAEMIIKFFKKGAIIVQFGTDYFSRIYGKSTLASPKIILIIFYDIFRLFFELKKK